MAPTRLNKLLSQLGVASRRLADDLIRQGRVDVNGRTVTELGTKVGPEDDVRLDGRRLKQEAPERRYLLMYKPAGVMSTRDDPRRRPTVIELLAKSGVKGYFYPVGRLDFDSEGLMILTNDGGFAERVTHPRYELDRTYEVLVAGVPDDHDLDRLQRGIVIEGRRTLPAKVRVVRILERRQGTQTLLELTLREGRNRQVRHMCEAVGHPVDRLRRTHIGAVSDSRLRPGQIRDLTPAEVRLLTANDAKPAPRRPRKPAPESRKPVPPRGSSAARE